MLREIAHFVADGRPGGGTTVVLALVDAMRADPGFRVTLIGAPDSFLEAEAHKRSIPFVGINLFRSVFDPTPPWRLARKLAGRQFSLTHVHGLRAAHHAVRQPLRSKLGRLIYTVHGLHQLHQPGWLRLLANRAERRVMAAVDETVFVAAADLDAARRWRLVGEGQRAQVIVNGVDVASLACLFRQERRFDAVFVARHVPQKNPEQAARVLARLASSGWRCAMAGGGESLAAVQELLHALPGGERVVHYAELNHAEALAFLADARVVISPSRWEGLPVLPLEAMAMGVVPVVSAIDGHVEIIEDGVNGRLVPPGDDAMIEAVLAVLSSPVCERFLQTGGLERVKSRFDRATMLQRYLAVYGVQR